MKKNINGTDVIIDMGNKTKPTKEDKKALKEIKKEINTLLKNPQDLTVIKF